MGRAMDIDLAGAFARRCIPRPDALTNPGPQHTRSRIPQTVCWCGSLGA